MRKFALLLALALVACRGTPTQPLNGDIVLQLGQSTTIAGLTVTFRDMLGDSRCPRDVLCIWAGNAKVQLDLAAESGRAITVTLDTSGPRDVVFLARRIELVDLTPYPDSRIRIAKSAYHVRLRAGFLPD
ncbi:MAG: hypothetical protein Q7J79_03555 [Gemmatimonadales bacterium]|nr:hypothetical protein [Gemmatimonadales bacterium]